MTSFMKKWMFLLIVPVLWVGCTNGTTEENGANGTEVTPPGNPVVGAEQGAPVSPQTEKVLGFLANNFWVVEGYVKGTRNTEAYKANQGRWYQLLSDGTYTYGQWDKTTGKGVRSYDPQKALVHLDSSKDEDDGEYSLKMSKDGSLMVLIGTERYGQNSIQMKLGNYVAVPDSVEPLQAH